MRLLVLGTSNSRMRLGWTLGLQEALPGARIENLAIGGSPGVQFAAQMGKDFSQYDAVFVDSLPNDEVYAGTPGYSSEGFVNAVMAQIYATIAAQTRLVVVNFTNKQFLHRKSRRNRQADSLARSCGAHLLDIAHVIRSFEAEFTALHTDLYESIPHPHRDLARSIGFCLGKAIAANGLGRLREATSHAGHFSLIGPDEYAAPDRLQLFSNSVMSEKFAMLDERDVLEFDGSRGICLGFYANYAGTSCSVNMASFPDEEGNARTVSIVINRDLTPAKTLKIFVPVPDGIRLRTLSVTQAPLHAEFRPRITRRIGVPPHSVLAMSSLVFWSGEAGPAEANRAEDADAATRLTFDVCREAATLLREKGFPLDPDSLAMLPFL